MTLSLVPEIPAPRETLLWRWVSTPLAMWERVSRRRDEEAAWAAVLLWARVRPRHILYVDGDCSLLRSAARELEGVGARCSTAGSHGEAIAALARDAGIGAAILEFSMPEGDAGILACRLRSARPDLLLVGTGAADRRRAFRRLGVDRFLPKPWRLEDLTRAVGW
jgi:CheY-like chemotaxis protein